jgi:hypothetical protein
VHDIGGEAFSLHQRIQRPHIIAPALLNLDVTAVDPLAAAGMGLGADC